MRDARRPQGQRLMARSEPDARKTVRGEARRAMEIAGSLLAAGLDDELVARLSGLTVDQLSTDPAVEALSSSRGDPQ